jgi:Protein of unknown function (DUF3300)
VKALTQFPSELDKLSENQGWTSNLGQAFQNQQSDVMAANPATEAGSRKMASTRWRVPSGNDLFVVGGEDGFPKLSKSLSM